MLWAGGMGQMVAALIKKDGVFYTVDAPALPRSWARAMIAIAVSPWGG